MASARDRWNARYSTLRDESSGQSERWSAWPRVFQRLVAGAQLDRYNGLAIDLAGGDGAAAVGMAKLGFDAMVIDVSDVALGIAAERAAAAGVRLETLQMDLTGRSLAEVLAAATATATADVPDIAVVSCVHYLNRDLLSSVAQGLPAGAVFMASIATTTNLERNPRPSERFLLAEDELRTLVVAGKAGGVATTGLEVLHDFEGWNEDGAHEAELVVRAT